MDSNRSNATASFVLGPTHNHIYVHTLVSNSEGSPIEQVIDAQKLTYASRPDLGEKIGSLHLDYGFEWSHKFPCAMDSLHAFALIAADDSTHVEWWQDKQGLTPGKSLDPCSFHREFDDPSLSPSAMYIEQHATK